MYETEVNIDQVVDYKSEYWAYIKKPRISGDELTGLCPFHEDHNNSFSVDLKTGKWHCHAEDIGGNFTSFYAKIHGVDTKTAYKQILDKYGISSDTSSKNKTMSRSYTLAQYSFEKHLPEQWLAEYCHIETVKDRDGTLYMKIPYYDSAGKEQTFRKRYAHKEFKWKYGSAGKIGLYGEWQIEKIRAAGYVALVEGESDSQSMWHMGVSCLGVPGASMFKPKQAEFLQDLKLYIHQEPDRGGETFVRKILEGLREGGFIGEVYCFSCSTVSGCKDPSDLYMKFGKDSAASKVVKLIEKAKPLSLEVTEVIPDAIKDAPVNLRRPRGWEYSDDGIFRFNEKDYEEVLVCRTPIILTRRLKSLDTGEEKMEIAFKRDSVWQRQIFPRSTIFTARGITVLSDLGCTVTSENAKNVVRFLSALEAENIDIITKEDSTSTFGWQPGGRFIPGKEDGIVLDIDPSQKSMAAAYCKNGTLEAWVEIMRPHREREKFRFILAASFAAPLLKIVRQRIFFIYNWGSSKGGKTAGLKAALSAWGDPERLMVNFNATQVGLERTAAFYSDLPLGIDERQLAGDNQASLEKIVYMIASGTGKIRGAKSGGIQSVNTWRTVAMATGEESLTTDTSQTGVSTRVLEIYGGPFDSEQEASAMHQASNDNYGWAGPEFIRKLISISDESVVKRYEQMQKYVGSVSNGKSGSHVAGIALVALADAMIDTWFFKKQDTDDGNGHLQIEPDSWEKAEQMAKLILENQMSAEAADVNENAVQFIVDWVASNHAYFGEKAIGTCLGVMSESGNIAYIFPSVLNQAIKHAGFSPRKTLKYMADRGLITVSERSDHSGQTYSVTKRFDNRVCRFVEFFIGKLSEAKDPLDIEENSETTEEGFTELPEGAELPFD